MTIDGLEHGATGDADLLAGVRSGDATSFAELYDRHAAAALTVARQYTNSREDAEDVVADAFAAVYATMQRGNGPQEAFRAYLFTVVRRVAAVRREQGRRVEPTDDVATLEAGSIPLTGADDPTLAGFERGVVARAFRSLPERWQLVLWHSEVEGLTPAQIAPLLGLTANGTAALAYRAREGLRQAYLAEHLAEPLDTRCRDVAGRLGAYVRGGLGQRETRLVETHLDECLECRALVVELGDVNHGMRGVVAPLVLGVVGMGALTKGLTIGGGLAALPMGGAPAGGSAAGGAGAGGSAAGGTAAGGSVTGAGAAATGGAAAATSAAAGGAAAGSAAAASGLGALLAAIPAGVAAAVVGGVVVVAAAIVVVSQLLGGGGLSPDAGASPSTATAQTSSQPVSQPPSPAAFPPDASPSAPATAAPPPVDATPAAADPAAITDPVSPAHLVVDLPADGLALAAGVSDQLLSVGIRNTGGTDATALLAELTLPAGVQVTNLVSGNLNASGGAAVPAPSWVCVPGSGGVSASCQLATLPAGGSTTLQVHVAVPESYDATDGNVGLRIEGTGVDLRLPAIPVQVSAAPARLALRSEPAAPTLVAGRVRELTLELANEGGRATTASDPARVTLTLPAGLSSTATSTGPWTCPAGTGTVVCTAALPARTSSTLTVRLAAASGTASTQGEIGLGLSTAHRAASGSVGYAVVAPATLVVDLPDSLTSLARGSVTEVPVQVTNTGALTSAPVTVSVSAPAGADWASPGVGEGWSCQPGETAQICTHPALAPGDQASLTALLTARPGIYGPLGDLSVTASASDADADGPRALPLAARAPTVRVDTSDARLLLTEGEAGTLTFTVAVGAQADADDVVASIALPAGVRYDPDAGVQTPGCAPGSSSRLVLCTLGRLAAGSSTPVLVHVRAAGATTADTSITVTAAGDIAAAPAWVRVVASSGGLTPRYSVAGDVHVTQVGAPLLSCQTQLNCDAIVTRGTADNNGQLMTPLDENPPVDVTRPAVRAGSSTTELTLPAGTDILWAGLYWSADAYTTDAWNTSRTSAKLAGPGGSYQDITGTLLVDDLADNAHRRYYQTFADVTDQVRQLGAGRWSLADMAVSATTNQALSDANYYAGWSLVVVYGTAAPRDTASRSVTVYDGGAWAGTQSAAPVFDFTAAPGTAATIGVVAWEGDQRATGDALSLNGQPLTPVTWAGGDGSANNAFDSTATGWRAMNSLGVDAKAFRPAQLSSGLGSLTATTSGDQYLIGAITVEAEAPTAP